MRSRRNHRPLHGLGDTESPAPAAPPLLRLPSSWHTDGPPAALASAGVPETISADAVPFDWAQATAAAIGTVAHRMLAEIARDGLGAWTMDRVAACRERVDVALAGEGVAVAARDEVTARVLAVLERTLNDARGRWLFAPEHAEARSEWALAGFHNGAVDHVTLDRTFVVEGVRWIVDFKTGRHEGGDATTFLDREQARYRAQLERYARIVRGLDARPIRLALYFPLVEGGWREWCCDAASTSEMR